MRYRFLDANPRAITVVGVEVDGKVTIDGERSTFSGTSRRLLVDPADPRYADPAATPEEQSHPFTALLDAGEVAQIMGILAAAAMRTNTLRPSTPQVTADSPGQPPPPVQLSIMVPGPVVLGGTLQLDAHVAGVEDQSVLWRALSTDGGTVDADGLYTAPKAPGTYIVGATCVAEPLRAATAIVTVTAA